MADNVVLARNTDEAPQNDRFAQTVAFSHYNNISAQLPIDPETGAIVEGGIFEQAEQCFENLEAIVESIDHSLNDVARITVFVRDIREIRFANEEVPPVIGPFVDDGHDYTNRPNVAAKAEYVGRVGEPMEFTGWAHDFDKRIIAVEFSLDNGANWTTYDVSDSTDDLWVHWTFSYTPERPGFYRLLVRSVNDAGAASPLADVAEFTAA